jgi:polysaccharide pyruvyl transferase WcaK-like protein
LRLVAQSTAPGGDDRIPIERIAAQLPAEVIIPSTIREAAEAYAGCRLVICQRMHAAIFALKVGRTVLVVSHEPKMDGLMADFDMSDAVITTSKGLGDEVRRRLMPPVILY